MNFTELKFFRYMIDFNNDSDDLIDKDKKDFEKSMELLSDSIFSNIVNDEDKNNEFEFYNNDVIEFPLHNKKVYLTDILSPHWQLLSDIDKKYIKKLIKDISIKYLKDKNQMDKEIHKLLCMIHMIMSIFTTESIKKSVKEIINNNRRNVIQYCQNSFIYIASDIYINKTLKFKIPISINDNTVNIIYTLNDLKYDKSVIDDKILSNLNNKLNNFDAEELFDIITTKSKFLEFVNFELNKKENENV